MEQTYTGVNVRMPRVKRMARRECDEPQAPELQALAEEMEGAMAQARKATTDLPPLDELAALQEAMAGLARMGALTEKIRLAAQEGEERRDEAETEVEPRSEAGHENSEGHPGPGDEAEDAD
jgi:hypothetical protein